MTSPTRRQRWAPRRLIAFGLAVIALSVAGLGCGEKDEPAVSAPETTTLPTTTTPTP